MTITLPDIPDTSHLAAAEMRLELGCALYARGRVGKIGGAELAGVDFFSFQRALEERGIPLYSEQMLADDLETSRTLFPR